MNLGKIVTRKKSKKGRRRKWNVEEGFPPNMKRNKCSNSKTFEFLIHQQNYMRMNIQQQIITKIKVLVEKSSILTLKIKLLFLNILLLNYFFLRFQKFALAFQISEKISFDFRRWIKLNIIVCFLSSSPCCKDDVLLFFMKTL